LSMTDCRTALGVQGLKCRIRGKLILDSVSFSVGRGELLALIGPNGAGKTTLLKCLMRIIPFDDGSVELCGKDVNSLRQKSLARCASYVPQADSRYLPFTAGEFVMTGRYPHLSPFTSCSAEDRGVVYEAMKVTGTSELKDRRMSSLSGGERQLVMIAAALAQESPIMLLDEPAAFLDPGHEHKVMRLLGEINERLGTTIVMVTHDINRAILTGGLALVLDRGRVEYFDRTGNLASSGVLERIYERRFAYVRHPVAGCDIIVPEVTRNEG
jgi:iron complex transport system ATP-binding protein